jgi:hypothetical protein
MYDKKTECVHKFNGQSLLVVFKQHNNKYFCKCSSCQEISKRKFKQIPVDAQWELLSKEG